MGIGWLNIGRAFRSLARRPGFTAAIVLTLGIGIGATSAVFSLINGVLLKPMPYPESDEIVTLWFDVPTGPGKTRHSIATYLFQREHSEAIHSITLAETRTVTLNEPDGAVRLESGLVTHGVFDLLKTQPQVGRAIQESDERVGAEPVVLLTDGFWASKYARDPSIVGRTISIDGVSRTVIGVLPRGLRFPSLEAELWIPYEIDPTSPRNNASFIHRAYGRLLPGQTVETAEADLLRVTRLLPEFFPQAFPARLIEQLGVRAIPLRDEVVGDTGPTLWIIFGSVSVVLLIAAANVANLVLVRTEARGKEIAIHLALGSGRQRVVGATMLEAILLAGMGGIAGLATSVGGLSLLRGMAPAALPRLNEVGLDPATLAFTAVVALTVGIGFGSFPAFRVSRMPPGSLLRSTRGASGAPRTTMIIRNALVVGQVALALVALVGSGLMLRSFTELRNTDPGFRPEGVTGMRVALPASSYPDDSSRRLFFNDLLERVRSIPGVESAALTNYLPLRDGRIFQVWSVEEFPRPEGEIPNSTLSKVVSEDYFQTLGIELLEGRGLVRQDSDAGGPLAAVVNRAFADLYWPGTSPIGKRIRLNDQSDWFEIVGVVESVRDRELGAPAAAITYTGMLDRDATGVYVWADMSLAVKARGGVDPVPAVRDVLRSLDPTLPLFSVGRMTSTLAGASADTRFTFVLLTVAALSALVLGAIGLYGVLAFVVGARTREIGVRMALGANPTSVRRMIERQALGLTAVGVLMGVAASFLGADLLSSVLHGVSPSDPITLVAVSAVLISVAWLAAAIPARRAARTDPMIAMNVDE